MSPYLDKGARLTLTIEETAQVLGLSKSATYQAAKDGEIPTITFGHLIRVPIPALQKLLRGPIPSPRFRKKAP
jgi:excisionase family DNA binding protein